MAMRACSISTLSCFAALSTSVSQYHPLLLLEKWIVLFEFDAFDCALA